MHSNEDILKQALLKELQIKFQFQEEGYIIPYFLFRQCIVTNTPPRKAIFPIEYLMLGRFILEECRVEISKTNTITADETSFSSEAFYGTEYRNIMEDWWFQTGMLMNLTEREWEQKYKGLIDLAKKSVPVKVSHPMYQTYLQSSALSFLNEAFKVAVSGDCGDRFVLTDTAWIEPTREEELMRYIQAYSHMLHKSYEVTEEQVENYLMRNLNVIEEGLRMIDNQVELEQGRIDILARDSESRDVIIEVKVDKDTDLIWQRMYYESEWKKRGSTPRMMVVTTKPLDASIKDMLEKVGRTMVLEVTPYVQNKEIKKIKVDKRYVLSPEKACHLIGQE